MALDYSAFGKTTTQPEQSSGDFDVNKIRNPYEKRPLNFSALDNLSGVNLRDPLGTGKLIQGATSIQRERERARSEFNPNDPLGTNKTVRGATQILEDKKKRAEDVFDYANTAAQSVGPGGLFRGLTASQKVRDFGVDALQGAARDITAPFAGGETITPDSRVQKAIFGEEPFNIETVGREYADIVGKGEDISRNTAVGIGLFAGVLSIPGRSLRALKESSQILSKLSDTRLIKNELRRLGIKGDEKALEDLASGLRTETDAAKIERTLSGLSGSKQATGGAVRATNESEWTDEFASLNADETARRESGEDFIGVEDVDDIPPQLAQEARKYDTAEEFVEAQPQRFHVTTPEGGKAIDDSGFRAGIGERTEGMTKGEGVWLFDDLGDATEFRKAEQFFREGESVAELKPAFVTGKVKDMGDENILRLAEDKDLIDNLRSEGFVGIKANETTFPAKQLKPRKNKVTFIFDESSVKTRSQLTDIFNRAKGRAPQPAPPSAKKLLGQEPPRRIQRSSQREDVALRQKLKQEQTVANRAARSTRKTETSAAKAIRARELEELRRTNNLSRLRQRITDRFRFIERGIRKGGVQTKRQIKAVQDEVIETIENAGLPLKERGKFLRTVKNIQTRQQLAKQLPKVQERISRTLKRVENKRIVKGIEKKLRSVKAKKDTSGIVRGKLTPERQEKIDSFKEILNEKPVKEDGIASFPESEAKLVKNLEEMQAGAENALELADENYRLQFAGLLSDAKRLEQFETEDLARLSDEIDSLIQNGRMQRELDRFNFESQVQRANDYATDVALAGKELDETIDAGPVAEGTFRRLTSSLRKYGDMHLNLDFWAAKVQSKNPSPSNAIEGELSKFTKKIHDARRAYNKDVLEVEDVISEKIYSLWDLGSRGSRKAGRRAFRLIAGEMKKPEPFPVKLTDGTTKEVQLDRWQMIAKWMQSKQTHTRVRLKQGNKWSDETIDSLDNILTREEKALGQWFIDDFYPKMAAKADPFYERYTGLRLSRTENYSPSPTKSSDTVPEHIKLAQESAKSSTRPSAVKARVNLENVDEYTEVAALEFDDALQTAVGHGVSMNHFVHFTEPITFWRSLMRDGSNRTFRKALVQEFDPSVPMVMDRMLDDIARGGIQDKNSIKFMDKLTGNVATAILSMNPTQLPKQLVSTSLWFAEGGKSLTAMVPRWSRSFRSVSNEMWENSSFLQSRGRKRTFNRDTKFHMETREVQETISGRSGFTEIGMNFVKLGDRGGIMSLGGPYYMAQKARYLKEGLSESEAIKLAISDFERAAKRIQQSTELEDLGQIQRAGGLFRAATLFTGTPMQMLRWEMHALRSLGLFGSAAKRGSLKSNIAKLALIHANFMLFQYVADGFEFNEERQMRAGILGPMGSWFILGSVFDNVARTMSGDDVFGNEVDLTGFTKLAALGETTSESALDIFGADSFAEAADAVSRVMAAILDFRGVPASNTRDIIEKSVEFAKNERTDPREIIWSDYALKNTGRGKQSSLSEDLDFDLDLDLGGGGGEDLDLDLDLGI